MVETYNGLGNLTDRELLVKLYERVDVFIMESRKDRENLDDRLKELEKRPCPAKMCYDHEKRLGEIELTLAQQEKKIENTWVRFSIIGSILLSSILIALRLLNV